ncbi:hypothetical protein BDQ12DRAFT_691093 [Crucibulum laeve]|uniref:Indole-diterpene biosynthesis protein PaxU n=1 Tax=Crucibulum laeve TaxID=68775 RepID=A0A5C3LN85_9AGAR|nr:hypothetical protein BDQ12DRAFT_691093 [Crucibulum laeve]
MMWGRRVCATYSRRPHAISYSTARDTGRGGYHRFLGTMASISSPTLTPSDDPGFVSIGKGVYLSRPQNSVGQEVLEQGSVPPPTVILIFGWMGARLPHLYKYTKAYDSLFPNVTKILIRSEAAYFWNGEKKNEAHLAPVVEVLRGLGCVPSKPTNPMRVGDAIEPLMMNGPPRVLMHAFSNGGCFQLATLSSLLSHSPASPFNLLPPSALIIDSAPGSGGIRATQRAFSSAIRNPIIRHIANGLIALIYLYAYAAYFITRRPNMLDRMRALLLEPGMFPWTHMETRRLYVFSNGDDIVPVGEVERHVEEAVRRGWVVRRERFDSSMHVAHARLDAARYWGAVKEVWEEAVRAVED